MSWPGKIIRLSFYLLVFLVPAIFLPNTSELFEFNKMIVTYLLTIIIATAWLTRMVFDKRIILRRTPLDLPILIFLFIQLLSLLFSIDQRTSWLGYYSRFNGGLVSLFCYSLLYWAFVSNMDRRSATRTLNIALIAAGLISAYGVLEHFGIDAKIWVQDVQSRVFSTLGQPNWLAAYLAILLPVSISFALSAKTRLQQTGYFTIAMLCLTSILFTKSQSGIAVTLLILLIYLVFLLLQKHHFKIIGSGVAMFVLLLAINFGYIQSGIKSLTFLFITKDLDSYTQEFSKTVVGGTSSTLIRRIVWQGGINIWRSSPKNFWLGSGSETFGMAFYQHRPIALNYTSEWELLYNKAHNEFVNYLATSGILGLGSYLILLASMFYIFLNKYNHPAKLALAVGWLSIPITNFWGFSVVIVQILMFLFPAILLCMSEPETPAPKKPSVDPGWGQIFGFLSIMGFALYLIYTVIVYWSADAYYAASQKNLQTFSATQSLGYLSRSYENLIQAYDLNPNDPPINAQLGLVAANMAVYSLDAGDSTASAQYVNISQAASEKSVMDSPLHPNYYKIKARSEVILSLIDPKYMDQAVITINQAIKISPTDPRLPYQLGLIAQRAGNLELAKKHFREALTLKSDFADAIGKLNELVK